MAEPKEYTIVFQPAGRRGRVEAGITIIEASRRLGVDIETLCGEKRVCGKCKVRVEEGSFEKLGIVSNRIHAGPWQDEEAKYITDAQKAQGFRLGCVAKVQGDLLIFVPEESRAGEQVVSKAARDITVTWDPAVKLYYIELEKPTLEKPTADLERVLAELARSHALDASKISADFSALQTLSNCLRDGDWKITVAVWMDKEIIRFVPGRLEEYFGVAIDLGTTTCAAYLCELSSMKVAATASMMNPQCKYGEDVMSRITYHMMNPDGLTRMRGDIVTGLNDLIAECCQSVNGLAPSDLLDLTLVGNTAMHHIFLGFDPEYLGRSPFPPVVHQGLNIKARDLGLNLNPAAYVYVLPIEAGFVGADNVGVLISEEPYNHDEMQLIIDIGTNGELVLGNRHRLVSSSCATGPALEGAQITWGMRAAPGAIEHIGIDPQTHEVDYKVVGRDAWKSSSQPEEMKAKGICGSGILDLMAELYRSGVILKSGRFSSSPNSSRLRSTSENSQPNEFVLAWANETSVGRDIVVTQKDVRQIQLAKGALYTGCKLMMGRLGVDRVDVVKIAGAFGTHVDREKALIMGLFPDCSLDRIRSIGNAAGDGARIALLNRRKRQEAEKIARQVEYMELNLDPEFQTEFLNAMYIPHMLDEFSHLEGLVPPQILHQK
ncbi:MAG: DUF4445 domain-containing protein [Deltaproteobacteria bacterium]|nr:DUF4445 domain-containing protein [Deltaproteobacteria bacterium]